MIFTRLAVIIIAVIRAGRIEVFKSIRALAVSTIRGMKNKTVII